MRYKLQNGGIIKLQNAGSLPKWMQKLNSWSIPDSDESAGERILNSTIEQANEASTQEERDQIYKDSAKKNLAVTGQSLIMLPMLGELTTYGLLGGGLRLGAGITGSKAGEYVLGKGGDWLDKQLRTKFLGTTGRILGGLGGWWGGSSATTPLFRNLAGKGITLHMPQEIFMNLRGQYFNKAAENIKLDASTLPKLQYRDRLTKDYLEFGTDSNIYGDNVSKLVHWDPMTTGTKSALPINGGFNRDPIYFPHFENGKLVPAIGQIQSKLGNGQMYEHPYHPIFFGGNKPWWETPGSNFSDQYLKETTFNKSKFAGPKQYYDRWAKREKQNLRNLRNWYTKYGPQNKSDRYLITDPENLVDYEFSHKLGIMGSEVSMSKLEGFEYDPLLGTFKRAKYIDPSISTIPPQEMATTYHFDGRMPLSKSIGIAEKAGISKGDRGLFNWDQIPDLIPRFNKWAQYYGYETVPESTSIQDAVNIMKNTFKRHNTFFRGVHKPDTPEDVAHIEGLFGKDYNLDDVYKYVATHGRPGDNAVFVSPLSNAGIYGSTGKTAIVRRRFKLGRNPETWLQDADFDIIFGGSPEAIKAAQQKGTLTFPWGQRGHGIVENELLAPDGTINFIDFVPQNASTSYFDSNGSLNKYLGYKSFGDVYGFGDYNHFTDIPVEKPKFKQGGKI